MSKIHVLKNNNGSEYSVVLHFGVPSGSNSASKTWKNCLVGSGANTSILAEGIGAGQISTAELSSIVAGDVVEELITYPIDSSGATADSLTEIADAAIVTAKARLQGEYKYYGFTQG